MIVRLKLPEKTRRPLLQFVDAYLPLSAAQEEEFDQEIKKFRPKERKVAMEYITSWERKGIEKGRVQGKLEGKLEAAVFLLTQQIGQIGDATAKRLRRLSLEKIDALLGALRDFKSKADLDRWLRTHAPTRRKGKLKGVAAITTPKR